MSFVTSLATFAIVWWLVLFTVLPIGVERNPNPQPGTDPGAPKTLNLKRKFALTTIIAFGLTAAILITMEVTGFDFYTLFSQ
ncbi:MAG: DUF1467 family protein [Candidatus Pacebacteria bacterium]|nr:DUF1467 family protein [Candidatus Paceibacterota bacterium]